jgi:hypothetical protein
MIAMLIKKVVEAIADVLATLWVIAAGLHGVNAPSVCRALRRAGKELPRQLGVARPRMIFKEETP